MDLWQWAMLVGGSVFAAGGVVSLVRRGRVRPVPPMRFALGEILVGAALAVDGLSRIVGWSSGRDAATAGVDMLVIVIGMFLQARSNGFKGGRRVEDGR